MPYDNTTHKYTPPEFEYYVLTRNDDYLVNSVVLGTDPLYGYGSWNLFAGPFDSIEEAYISTAKDILA